MRQAKIKFFLQVFIFLHNFNLPFKTKQLTSKISLVCLDCLLGQRTMCGIIIILIFRLYLPNSIWWIFQFLSGDNEIIKKKKPTPERLLLISVPFGASAHKLHTTHSLVCPFSSLVLKAPFEVSHQIQKDPSEGGSWDRPRPPLRGNPT